MRGHVAALPLPGPSERRQHHVVGLDRVVSGEDAGTTEHLPGKFGQLGRKELAEQIRTALEDLPFDQRTALVLREIDGLSYEEIGYSLGIAVGTVKSRLARARESLRARLRTV